ncbi:MAG: hypothetical protein ACYC56_08335 [Candidatus Aquicultor sp.]
MVVVMYVISISLGIFITAGLVLTVSAIRSARRQHRLTGGDSLQAISVRQRIRRYEGPIKPDMPLFNPAARIAIEFACALCGFPGLGWMISGNIFPGLILMSVVPAFVWAFYPIYLALTGGLSGSPFVVVSYLPVLAMVSSGCLAANQIMVVRKQGDKVDS